MITHHEVVPSGHYLRTPVLVTAILRRYERLFHQPLITEDATVDDADVITLYRDDALDKRFVGHADSRA